MERHKDPHLNRYCFSGKIVCGECGSFFNHEVQYLKDGKRYFWSCAKHTQDAKSCSIKRILEQTFENAFLTMLNKLRYAEFILDQYIEETEEIETSQYRKRLDEIQDQIKQNTEKRHRFAVLLSMGCMEPVLVRQETIQLEHEMAELKEEQNKLENIDPETSEAREFRKFVHASEGKPFSPDTFETYVEKIVVNSRTSLTFHLKCGLVLTEDLRR